MSNYAKINDMDVVNGEGVRVSIFFSGCTHHCKNCFNSELWNFDYGVPFTSETIDTIIELMKPDYIKGLSILGGEPFQNEEALRNLARRVKKIYPTKDIWVWTGYEFNNIPQNTRDILSYVDVIVDGRYDENKKTFLLPFRGSENQKIWKKSYTLCNDIEWTEWR